mgnify:FL=1
MENLLISACLLGVECKYSGGSNALPEETIEKLRTRYRLIPVCPETAGGLPTPRDPSERLGERVVSCRGADVTAQFKKGAEAALTLARRYGCTTALMKEHSPSCGSGLIYDGSFSGNLVKGDGCAAELLKAAGVSVVGENVTELLTMPE